MLSGLPPIHYLTFSLSLSALQRLLKFSQASIFLIMCLLQVTLNKKSSGLSAEVELAWKKNTASLKSEAAQAAYNKSAVTSRQWLCIAKRGESGKGRENKYRRTNLLSTSCWKTSKFGAFFLWINLGLNCNYLSSGTVRSLLLCCRTLFPPKPGRNCLAGVGTVTHHPPALAPFLLKGSPRRLAGESQHGRSAATQENKATGRRKVSPHLSHLPGSGSWIPSLRALNIFWKSRIFKSNPNLLYFADKNSFLPS